MKKKIEINCRGAESVDFRSLTPFQGSLKSLSDQNYVRLRDELLRDGFCEPITVWKTDGKLIILNGHQRLSTITRMVTDEDYHCPLLPISIVYCRDQNQANELVLALTAQFGEMSNESLADFLRERNLPVRETVERFPHRETDPGTVIRLATTPVKTPDGDGEGGGEEDEAPPVQADPRVKIGDVFRLGDHLLVCGDSADGAAYLLLGLEAEPADLVVTDPPYNLAGEAAMLAVSEVRGDSYGRLKDSAWDKGFSPEAALELLLGACSPAASIYVFTSHFLFDRIFRKVQGLCDYAGYCVWSKSNPMPSLAKRHWTWNTELVVYGARKDHVFNFPEQGNALSTWTHSKIAKAEFHPTQKPVGVIEHAIKHSSNAGAVVLDAFGGSGTTLIACEKLGRKCRMIELNPQYVRVTIDRWEKLTGKTAELLSPPCTPGSSEPPSA